jgi:hypothetical protein
MKMNLRAVLFTGIAVAVLAPAPSEAIPAWTRRTGAECNACHFGASNRLTKMGWDFMTRGMRSPGDEGPTLDDMSDVNFLHYASIGARGGITMRNRGTATTPPTTITTDNVNLVAGGPLMGNIGFYTTYTLHPSAALGQGYAQYTSSPDADNFWWARVGRFNPHIIWMAYQVPGGPTPPVGRAIGGGVPYAFTTTNNGLSVGYDTEGGLRLEAATYQGLGGAGTANNFRDFFVSAQQLVGPYGTGVGVAAYTGRYTFPAAGTGAAATPAWTSSFQRYGIFGNYIQENWGVHGAYSIGRQGLRTGGNRSPRAWYVEGDYNVTPVGTAFLRYDNATDDPRPVPTTGTGITGASTITGGYSFRYTQFARFGASVSNSRTRGPGATNVTSLGLSWGIWL